MTARERERKKLEISVGEADVWSVQSRSVYTVTACATGAVVPT